LEKDIQQDLQENHWDGDHKTNRQIFCQDVRNQGLDIVEGSAPSETEEEPTHSFSLRGTGNVGALATLGNFAPTIWKKKKNFG
jgi:hypothetical protein